MDAERDDFASWIEALRGRIARGELADLGPVVIRGGMLSADLAARITLVDLGHDTEPASRGMLLADLRRLREQIG